MLSKHEASYSDQIIVPRVSRIWYGKGHGLSLSNGAEWIEQNAEGFTDIAVACGEILFSVYAIESS